MDQRGFTSHLFPREHVLHTFTAKQPHGHQWWIRSTSEYFSRRVPFCCSWSPPSGHGRWKRVPHFMLRCALTIKHEVDILCKIYVAIKLYSSPFWWPEPLENLTDLRIQTLLSSNTWCHFTKLMKSADVCTKCNKYQMKRILLVLTTFNVIICLVHCLQQRQLCIFLAEFQNISREFQRWSSPMISPTQTFSSERTTDLSSLFSISSQNCSTWGAGPSFSVFQQIPSVTDSSGKR